MAQRKKGKENKEGILGAAAQAIGAALGTIALRTGMAKPDPAAKAPKRAPRKAAAKKAKAKKAIAKKTVRKTPRKKKQGDSHNRPA
jgi:hypothetical protein